VAEGQEGLKIRERQQTNGQDPIEYQMEFVMKAVIKQ
jgi:hypothetical protein